MKKTDELEQITELYYNQFGESKTIWVLKDKELGAEFRRLRQEVGASQDAIARLMGLSNFKIPNIENGFEVINKDIIFAYLRALQTFKEVKELSSTK